MPAELFLEMLRQAAQQRAQGAHHRTDESVGRKDFVAVLRGAFLRQQGLLHRAHRAAALTAGARAAGADVGDDHGGDDEDQMARKEIDQIRDDRQRREEHKNVFTAIAVRQISPHSGQNRSTRVCGGDHKADRYGRITELAQVNGKDHAEIGKRKGAHAARDHQDDGVPLQVAEEPLDHPASAGIP